MKVFKDLSHLLLIVVVVALTGCSNAMGIAYSTADYPAYDEESLVADATLVSRSPSSRASTKSWRR